MHQDIFDQIDRYKFDTSKMLKHRVAKTFEYNDGGREMSGFNEKNDCTVRAFAIAFGFNYPIAHGILKLYGREDRKCTSVLEDVLADNPSVDCYWRPGMTVKRFISTFNSGKYIVRIRNHVFTVIDGVIHDANKFKIGSHVEKYWKIN